MVTSSSLTTPSRLASAVRVKAIRIDVSSVAGFKALGDATSTAARRGQWLDGPPRRCRASKAPGVGFPFP
jgi:hypothetical protein